MGAGLQQYGKDRRLAAQLRGSAGERGAAGAIVLRRQQRRFAGLHQRQHLALGAERADLAQSGERIEGGHPQPGGGGREAAAGGGGGASRQHRQHECGGGE